MAKPLGQGASWRVRMVESVFFFSERRAITIFLKKHILVYYVDLSGVSNNQTLLKGLQTKPPMERKRPRRSAPSGWSREFRFEWLTTQRQVGSAGVAKVFFFGLRPTF